MKKGTFKESQAMPCANLVLLIEQLKIKRESNWMRRLKEFNQFIRWRLYDKTYHRWEYNIKELQYYDMLRKLRKIAVAGQNLKMKFHRMTLNKKREAFLMIKMRSEYNLLLMSFARGFASIQTTISDRHIIDLTHAFSVIKILFEYKSEIDTKIKIGIKTDTVRACVNNNLIKSNRVRRRFIRHANDLVSNQNI